MHLSPRQSVAVALIVATLTISLTAALPSYAFQSGMRDGANASQGDEQVTDLFGPAGVFNTISSVLLFAVGAISVIMIIIGGLRYVISGGDSSNVAAAKNTVLYAVVGLIVALFAYAIINFVLVNFSAGGGGGGTNV